MGKTKTQKAYEKNKVQKIVKYSLMSPYFTYYETMPSKNSKDFVNNTFTEALKSISEYQSIIVEDKDCEPNAKRQKTSGGMHSYKSEKYSHLVGVSRYLQKSGALTIGLNSTTKKIKHLLENPDQNKHVLVFLIHDKDHEAINA